MTKPKIFYNEIDPFAAVWLRELIKKDLIAPGVVDERSIEDIKPEELNEYTQCHFFAGIGVWSYALRQAGWPDDRSVWTGSCPCQPFSTAGKGKGFADERHLWPAFFHLIKECKPDTVFGEQVAGKDGLAWLETVQDDMEGINYEFGTVETAACGFGAPHVRKRTYFVSHPGSTRRQRPKHNHRLSSGQEPSFTEPYDNFAKLGRTLDADFSCLLSRYGSTVSLERSLVKGYGNALVAPQAQAFIEAYLEK